MTIASLIDKLIDRKISKLKIITACVAACSTFLGRCCVLEDVTPLNLVCNAHILKPRT